jgi:uncharacterized protein
MTSPTPLSDEQLERLGQLLDLRAVPFGGFNLEALDGFLSALAVSPEPVEPEEWQPLVWGGTAPRWENLEESAEVQGLLLAHWQTCVKRARLGDDLADDYSPLLWLPEDPLAEQPDALDIGHDWAHGFFRAVELREDGWQKWVDSQDWIDEIFGLVQELATGLVEGEEGELPEPVTYRERLEIVASLPGMLADLNDHRVEQGTPREPARRADQPDRNAPCPCGSGKKYKKCHGA